MKTIYFYQNHQNPAPRWPPLRQTFNGGGYVLGRNFQFVCNEPPAADYLLALADGTLPAVQINIPRNRRILVLMENPSIWSPPKAYLEYFGLVLSPTPMPMPQGTRCHVTHPAVTWFYGMNFRTDRGLSHEPVLHGYLELNDLAELAPPPKPKLLSCVVSQKMTTPGHSWRVHTALELKKHFGDNIDMFGFGWNPIADKRDAIDPYAFSVVIENEERENYWTEKLSDAILGYSEPIYSGAPNINAFFDHPLRTVPYGIAPTDFVACVAKQIENLTDRKTMHQLRHQILFEHNLFYHVANVIQAEAA